MTKTNCSGWSRYNNGQTVGCDQEADDTGYCPIHKEAAATDPLGVKGYKVVK